MSNDFYKLMLVTHRENSSLTEYLDFIKKCISSGVTCVQLREKNGDPAFKLQFAQRLQQLLKPYNVPLIINDDVELALQTNADGVHLGQSDGSPQIARSKLGSNKYIGLSIESENELKQANDLNLNYVAASAVFPTPNKKNLKTLWGLEGVSQLCNLTKHPLIGIGGITQDNLPQLIQAGAQGAAIIGALHQAENPSEMALKLRKIIDNRNFKRDRTN
ncbi:thiamine phosphate synthase [Legionella maioricensis]|uniref:Thiamine-phosphate synthase n=1 Tax=Legionella maioricensis TaxID=2896528 RepID=A0A9X2CZD1_9GAMM|nr:thiamine phosphate synthase [Legionella maioricensis]MCL9683492.1 thiamine phosphate synthase [Legionella maioricensis]MCL9686791.1 thiamine phosphate synthase [Legionella maioricensis]